MSALPPIPTAKADSSKKACPLYPRKRTLLGAIGMSAKGQKRTLESEHYVQLRCLGDPCVDFATKHPEIDGFCKKSFGAAFQGLLFSLGIPVGGDHYDRDVRSNRFGFRQHFKAGHPRHVDI